MTAPAVACETNEVNEGALRSVVAMIELRPDLWSQISLFQHRRRNRVYCFAALTCKLAGLDVTNMLKADPSGDTVYLTAQELLGLSTAQAARLFLWAEDDDGRHPTVYQLKNRITAITGVEFGGPA